MTGLCNCIKTAYFMEAFGAKHSALMHRKQADARSGEWTIRDWRIHFSEEKTVVIPLLIQYDDGSGEFKRAAKRILDEHDKLSVTLSQGYMDDVLLARHSAFEEEIIAKLMKRMKQAGTLPKSLVALI